MSAWSYENLGDLCSLITDGKHGDCKNEDNSAYYFISCKDVKDGRINYDNSRQIVHGDFAETHRRTDLKPGDILLTNSGTIGRLAIAPDDDKTPRTTFQKSVAVLKPIPQKISSQFLYYSLAADKNRLINSAGGAAQKNLLLGELRRFPVNVPPLPVQNEITFILSSYDDLIENNRRRIQLLEQAARLLYKEWFVHLRFPGHEHVKIKDGVPEGWKKLGLGAICTLRAGGSFKPKYQGQSEGDIPFIKVRDLSSAGNSCVITCADNWVSIDECAEFRGKPFPPGTSVFAKIGEALRKNRVRMLARSTLIDNNMMGAIPNLDHVDPPFLHVFLSLYDFGGNAGGAAVPFLSAKVLSTEKILVPSTLIRSQFYDAVGAMFEQITCLQKQANEAENARDLLLPRLLNGEIAV